MNSNSQTVFSTQCFILLAFVHFLNCEAATHITKANKSKLSDQNENIFIRLLEEENESCCYSYNFMSQFSWFYLMWNSTTTLLLTFTNERLRNNYSKFNQNKFNTKFCVNYISATLMTRCSTVFLMTRLNFCRLSIYEARLLLFLDIFDIFLELFKILTSYIRSIGWQ